MRAPPPISVWRDPTGAHEDGELDEVSVDMAGRSIAAEGEGARRVAEAEAPCQGQRAAFPSHSIAKPRVDVEVRSARNGMRELPAPAVTAPSSARARCSNLGPIERHSAESIRAIR